MGQPEPKTHTRRSVASACMERDALPREKPRFPLLNQATPYVVVALDADGQPDRALLIFPTVADADAHARYHQLDDYRVVPAFFSHVDPRRGT
ncbi:hypothetical protein [Frankia sp. Cas4]|uniref:hypothetical protein n=1 Tax=Frankia sp. Cas4 TaxID=3073927 RepID=UPI002AD59185|nr:hypothetical protein [Frankia sp. Cas4]